MYLGKQQQKLDRSVIAPGNPVIAFDYFQILNSIIKRSLHCIVFYPVYLYAWCLGLFDKIIHEHHR